MAIHYLLNHQQESEHFCLLWQGLFFKAYNGSALLLHELFGYQIKCKESKSCGQILYYVGFPASVIDRVMDRIGIERGYPRCLLLGCYDQTGCVASRGKNQSGGVRCDT